MHEYMRRLLLAQERGLRELLSHPDLWITKVSHDNHCSIHNGKLCDCDPDIELKSETKTLSILRDGSVITS